MVARMGPTGPSGVPGIVMVLVEDLSLAGHLLVSKSSSQSQGVVGGGGWQYLRWTCWASTAGGSVWPIWLGTSV